MQEITEEEHNSYLYEIFAYFDKNGDNKITASELEFSLFSLGITIPSDNLYEIFAEINQNNSQDFIDFYGFIQLMTMKTLDFDKEIQEAYKLFDKNEDGFITPIELKQAFCTMGEKITEHDVKEIYNHYDSDHDNKISYEDFEKMVKRK